MTPLAGPNGEMAKERFMILQMVQDGVVSPDEGIRLLEAMDRIERAVPVPAPPVAPVPPSARDVRILIQGKNGENEVDLVLPLSLVEMGLNLARRVAPDKVPDLTEIRKSIQEGFIGTLMNIDNGKEHVEIRIQERKKQ